MTGAGAALTQFLSQAEQSLTQFDPDGLHAAAGALMDTAAALEASCASPAGAFDEDELHALRERSAQLAERCLALREMLAAALSHAAASDHPQPCYRRPRASAAPAYSLMRRTV